MKRLVVSIVLIVSLIINSYGGVVTRNSAGYEREENTQYVTKDEFYKWSSEFQKYLDHGLDEELLYKVASRSELHGYRSDKFYDNGGAK